MKTSLKILLAVIAVQLGACAKAAQLPVSAGTGPNPTLPAPDKSLIPTIKVAKAVGWANGVAIDRRGGLLVADDVGNVVWRVSAAQLSRR